MSPSTPITPTNQHLVSAWMMLSGDVTCRVASINEAQVLTIGDPLLGIRITGREPAQWQALIDAATEALRFCVERNALERGENDNRDTLPVVGEVA